MHLFGGSYQDYEFQMFSASHFTILVLLAAVCLYLYRTRHRLKQLDLKKREKSMAFFLLLIEGIYHIWMIQTHTWKVSHALPLELCSISLLLAVALLWTGRKIFYEIVLFTGLLGASQALLTPYLNFDFPHFRFFHFFIVHMLLFVIPLYYTWIKNFRPSFYSVLKSMLFLNTLVPILFFINKQTGGNYLYLRHKPKSASLLDALGPYPWYIFWLELLVFLASIGIWLVFKEKKAK